MYRFLIIFTLFIAFIHTPALSQQPVTDSLLLLTADHKPLNTASLRGKVLFFNFWATSCIPCKEEMPDINNLYLHFKDSSNIAFLSIDVDGNSAAFMKAHNYTIPVYTIDGPVPPTWFRGVLPATVVITRSGQLAVSVDGRDNYEHYIGYLNLLRAYTN